MYPPVHAYPAWLTHFFRDHGGPVLPMHECVALAQQSHQGGVKWALIIHAVLVFSFSITPIRIDLNHMSAMYIGNREYPGSDIYPPGPIGYNDVVNTNLTFSVYSLFFPLNQWLADGLLVGPISNPVASSGKEAFSYLRLFKFILINRAYPAYMNLIFFTIAARRVHSSPTK